MNDYIGKTFIDYYPGGMQQPGRTYQSGSGSYRYGFNGKEKDNESPVQYDYGFRIYDPRLVRFKSVDPLASSYPWNSTYAYAEGDLIRSIDLDGLEKVFVTTNSFAPFDLFGSDFFGSYSGDGNNRKFGDGGSYRISGGVQLDLATASYIKKYEGITTSTYHRQFSPLPDYSTPSPSHTKVGSFSRDDKTKAINIKFRVSGSNEAAIVSSDIDNKMDISFKKINDNKFSVNFNLKGDRFPSNETFLVDEKGNKLFLGVSGINNENKDLAPYTEVPGDNDRDMSSGSFNLLFNTDNTFKGVELNNGTTYSKENWNKIFTPLDPKSKTTGTKVTDKEVKIK